QVVWLRMLTLTFGVTSFAVATVLCGFMGGLALGSFLAGGVADRIARPLVAYAGAELLIGATGMASPRLFVVVRSVYVALVHATGVDSLLALSLLRFVLAICVLLLPTALMGATLPLIVRSSLLRSTAMARNVSLLYALNTLGATAGAFVAGFYLIGRFGLLGSIAIAGALNVTAGLLALVLSRRRINGSADEAELHVAGDEAPFPEAAQRAVFAVFAVSGGLSLAYEVVWARVLSIFFDATTYGFTIMLTMVLLGIGAGSWLISPV